MNGQPPFMYRGRGFGPGPFMFHHHGGGHLALAWATFALVLLLVLTVGALIVARAASSRGPRHGRRFAFAGGPRGPRDPLELVRVRYARGEIGRDEFLQATNDLASSAPTEERPPAPPDV